MDTGLPMDLDSRAAGHADAVTSRDMANAVRVLAMDAIEASASGPVDRSLAMADVATVLWSRFLAFDPAKPDWADRDRFLLSAGTGSMLLNAVLHLTGHANTTIDELKCSHQRRAGTKARSMPDRTAVQKMTPRLGQNLANAVGMAFAERVMAEQHGADLVDHHTFMFASPACLTESAGHDAASLAGRLNLGRLILFFDEGELAHDDAASGTSSDEILGRFEACGWDVRRIDGHDHEAIANAIEAAKGVHKPSLIACRTTSGFGVADVQDIERGDQSASAMRRALAWPQAPFAIPDEIKQAWEAVADRGKAEREASESTFMEKDVASRAKFGRAQAGGLCDSWRTALEDHCRKLVEDKPAMAGQTASRTALETLTQSAPNIIDIAAEPDMGSDDHEPLKAAVMNGIAQHGGLLPYGGLIQGFSGHARDAIRQAALTGLRVVYILTEDDAGAGERLASLRAIPNLDVMRPADAVETAECWALALRRREGPSVLVQSQRTLPVLRDIPSDENRSERGAYVLAETSSGPRALTLLATGAEVQIALDARERLEAMGMPTAVVSLPCFERFDQQPLDYRASVLGTAPRLAIEAGNPFGWTRYVESRDDVVDMATVEAIVERVLGKSGRKLKAA